MINSKTKKWQSREATVAGNLNWSKKRSRMLTRKFGTRSLKFEETQEPWLDEVIWHKKFTWCVSTGNFEKCHEPSANFSPSNYNVAVGSE